MSYRLETYEWDRLWIEKTDDLASKRILYIGDSISYGTRNAAQKNNSDDMLFDGFATSKALDNPYYFDSLMLFAKQEKRRDMIIFNNGLHGWHLSEDEYKALYENFINELLEKFSGVPVMPVLTTFSTNPKYPNERVMKRNEIVKEIAVAKNLNVIDLYSVSEANQHLLTDGVHFVEDGYKVLASEVVKRIKEYI